MRQGSLVALLLLAFLGMLILWLQGNTTQDAVLVAATPPVDVPGVSISEQASPRPFSSVPIPARTEPVMAEVNEDCPPKNSPLVTDESEEEYKARALGLAEVLAESGDADYLLAAALLSQFGESDRPLELLAKASAISPRNRLVAWNRLTLCRDSNVANCDAALVEANAIKADGGNGAVWMEIAMRRLAEERPAAAIEAIRRAIAAPRIESYFVDHAMVLERALASRSDLSYRQRVYQGIGISAALVGSSYGITKHCEAVDEGIGVWLELCDRLGAKMFVDGKTLLDRAIGLALRKIAAGRSGDEAWIEKATADYEAFKTRYRKLMADRKAQALIENDEVLLRQYLENFVTYGELEAQERLRAEALRLQQDPDYDQCNFEVSGNVKIEPDARQIRDSQLD